MLLAWRYSGDNSFGPPAINAGGTDCLKAMFAIILVAAPALAQADWTKQRGELRQISVGGPLDILGVNENEQIFKWTGNRWLRIGGKLRHVFVGCDGSVWGVNSRGTAYRLATGSSDNDS